MAGTKISALTAAASFLSADELPTNEAGTTKKVTGTQIRTWIGASNLVMGAGNAVEADLFTDSGSTGHYLAMGASGVDLEVKARGTGRFLIDPVTAFANHIISTLSGTPSTSALGANVTSVTFTGNDTRGTIAIVMSGALAANTRIATCTYAATYGATAPIVMLANETAGAGLASINFYRLAVSTGVSFDLASDFALAAGTYTCAYIAIG